MTGALVEPLVLELADLAAATGTDLGPTRWRRLEQERIDAFAEVTDDRQWIHLDQERAAAGPFGATIAHGYLTLSLVSAFVEEMLAVTGAAMAVNYGLDRVRFPAPVPAGARVRATGRLASVTPVASGTQAVLHVVVTAEEASKPACVADMVVRYLHAAA